MKPDDQTSHEIAEIQVDDTLPSNEFRDIDIFQRCTISKYVKLSS